MSQAAEVIILQNYAFDEEAVAGYLHSAWPDTSLQVWQKRLSHWWRENPFHQPGDHHGFIARHEGKLVGFGGFIPARYAYQGQPVPGYLATSFKVEESFSKAAAKMFLYQRQVMKDHIIVHSTPILRIQSALDKMGGQACKEVVCHYIALGKLGVFNGNPTWPRLEHGCRVVSGLSEVTALASPFQRTDRLEKWITLDYLRWYLQAPMRAHHLIGACDRYGVLSSYLILAPRKRRGVMTWDVVDTFTTRPDDRELLALLGTLVHEPERLPGKKRLLSVTDFNHCASFQGMAALLHRPEKVCHYFLLPQDLQSVPKYTVLAEGDLGL